MSSLRFLLSLFTSISCSTTLTHAQSSLSSLEATQLSLSGHITPAEIFSFVYVPFDVTPDITSIYVVQNYSFKGAGNALDLGVFDPYGTDAINTESGFTGSRGWSGGFRSNFTVSSAEATPGYNPGPVLPGTWNVVLGPYATNRSGIDWTLEITLSRSPNSTLWSPSYAPISTAQLDTPTWLRGDFHAHSIYSDGRYLPSEQIANAVSQNLDFMFFSEHNTDSGNNDIGRWIPRDGSADNLLIGRAIEVTTRFGHWQAIGLERQTQVEWRYTNATSDDGFVSTAQQVRRSGGLVSVNHPFGNCSRCDWTLPWGFDVIESVEVWNGRWDPQDEAALAFWQARLAEGERVNVIGGSDAHSRPDLIGLPTTVVRVEGTKSQAQIVEAVKRGNAYLVEGPGMTLTFGVESGRCGQRVEMGGVATRALGKDAKAVFEGDGFQGARACWVSQDGYVRNDSIVDGEKIETGIDAVVSFLRVEVRNETDVLLGLTNPVYFE